MLLVLALQVFVFRASRVVLGQVKSVQDIEDTLTGLSRAPGGRSLGAIGERLRCLWQHPRPTAQDLLEVVLHSIVRILIALNFNSRRREIGNL